MDLLEERAGGVNPAAHWYYRSKARAIVQLLGANSSETVLDVGAGSGVFVRELVRIGRCRAATCIDPGYERDHAERIGGVRIEFQRDGVYRGEDCVLFVDVLEHVRDDVGLLRRYTGELKADAVVLVTVPAFRFLWSGHDVFLKHERRYTLHGLEQVVRRAGLRVERSRYFYASIFPAVAVARLVGRLRMQRGSAAPRSSLRPHARATDRALTLLHDLERLTLFRVNRLFGLTAFCLARRDPESPERQTPSDGSADRRRQA